MINQEKKISDEIFENENGICEVHCEDTWDNWHEINIIVTFKPNKKKLYNRKIAFMDCYRRINYQAWDPRSAAFYKFDYKEFCEELLSDENAELDLEKSAELFAKLKKYFSDFIIESDNTYFEKRLSIANGGSIYKLHIDEEKSVTLKKDEEDNIFLSWIKAKEPEKMLNKLVVLGLGL